MADISEITSSLHRKCFCGNRLVLVSPRRQSVKAADMLPWAGYNIW